MLFFVLFSSFDFSLLLLRAEYSALLRHAADSDQLLVAGGNSFEFVAEKMFALQSDLIRDAASQMQQLLKLGGDVDRDRDRGGGDFVARLLLRAEYSALLRHADDSDQLLVGGKFFIRI